MYGIHSHGPTWVGPKRNIDAEGDWPRLDQAYQADNIGQQFQSINEPVSFIQQVIYSIITLAGNEIIASAFV